MPNKDQTDLITSIRWPPMKIRCIAPSVSMFLIGWPTVYADKPEPTTAKDVANRTIQSAAASKNDENVGAQAVWRAERCPTSLRGDIWAHSSQSQPLLHPVQLQLAVTGNFNFIEAGTFTDFEYN